MNKDVHSFFKQMFIYGQLKYNLKTRIAVIKSGYECPHRPTEQPTHSEQYECPLSHFPRSNTREYLKCYKCGLKAILMVPFTTLLSGPRKLPPVQPNSRSRRQRFQSLSSILCESSFRFVSFSIPFLHSFIHLAPEVFEMNKKLLSLAKKLEM